MQTIDLVLMINHVEPNPDGSWPSPAHFTDAVSLGQDLYIGRRKDLADAVMDACEPVGENKLKPVRQFFSRYAMWREHPYDFVERYPWDSDRRLSHAVALSRLIRPTSMSYQYAARVRIEEDRREILPAGQKGPGSLAWAADESHDWLDDNDVTQLRRLLEVFDGSKLPSRIQRAVWYFEYTSWHQTVDIRWPLLVTGLEALVHTDKYKSTSQFVQRIPVAMLKAKLPVMDKADLEDIYDKRSGLAHGTIQLALEDDERRLYRLTEDALRNLILASIFDPAFAALFRSRESVIEAFVGRH